MRGLTIAITLPVTQGIPSNDFSLRNYKNGIGYVTMCAYFIYRLNSNTKYQCRLMNQPKLDWQMQSGLYEGNGRSKSWQSY